MQFADLKKYHYRLPEELIRKVGVEPRDSARLFVYDTATDTITFDTFRNLSQYLPPQSLLVVNDTRVLPARLFLRKETGGKIEVFVLANQIEDERRIPVLVDRKVVVGQKLLFPDGTFFEVVDQEENVFFVVLKEAGQKSLFELLEQYGTTPLPHYLEGAQTSESILRKRYQTVFANTGASVAAPTASLHFTEEVFESLRKKEIDTARVTLNVGLGTFAPLKPENFASGKLHGEYALVSEETAGKIQRAKKEGCRVVTVGTTVARTLESFGQSGVITAGSRKTDIFIFPPYQFHVVDTLITNFHLPETSLMLLVDAFLKHKGAKREIMELYQEAIKNNFAFYSFGDSMLIL